MSVQVLFGIKSERDDKSNEKGLTTISYVLEGWTPLTNRRSLTEQPVIGAPSSAQVLPASNLPTTTRTSLTHPKKVRLRHSAPIPRPAYLR